MFGVTGGFSVVITFKIGPVISMIGCFVIEGLWCSVHRGSSSGVSAVIQGSKILDISRVARRVGIIPGQTRRQAQLCFRDTQFFEYDEPRYSRAFEPYLNRCYDFTPVIEPGDARFFFADFTGCRLDTKDPGEMLSAVFEDVLRIDCSVYAGFAPSKYLAWALGRVLQDEVLKGNGADTGRAWFVTERSDIPQVTSKLPLRYLWSLDSDMARDLEMLGFYVFSDVAAAGLQNMVRRYGKKGRKLYSYSTGLDPAPVLPLYPPKSIIAGRMLESMPSDGTGVYGVITGAAQEIHQKLMGGGHACRRLSLTVFGHGKDVRTMCATRDFMSPKCGARQIAWAALSLFTEAVGEMGPVGEISGFQIEASALCAPTSFQANLSGGHLDCRESAREETLDRCMVELAPAVSALERKYGAGLVRPCTDLLKKDLRRESMLSYWDPVRSPTPD